MSNNSIIKDLVFPISLLLDTPKVRSQFNQLVSSNNLRGFNLYKVLEEGMKANFMQCLSSSDVTVNNTVYPAGTPITDLINLSSTGNSVWLNADGTAATSASTNIKYDRGNVTIGTGGLAGDYFSVIPKSTFVQDNILNPSIALGVSIRSNSTLTTAINSTVGYKSVFGIVNEINFNDASQLEHSHLSVVGTTSITRWLSPSPVRYLGNAFNIVYRGKDINSTINTFLINPNGATTMQAIADSTQSSSIVQSRAFSGVNYSNSVNTVQNITTLHQNPVGLSFSYSRNNIINIATLEQFSNTSNMNFNAYGVGSSINITNLYGLRLISPTTYLNTNITNNYGISQEWSSAKNYFAGNVGIGTNNPSVGLDLVGHFKQPSGFSHYLGESQISDISNSLYLRSSFTGNNMFVSNVLDTNLYNFNIKANTTDLTGRLVVGMNPSPYWNALFKDYSDNSGIYISSVSAGGGKYIAGNSYYSNGQQWRSDKNESSIINLDNGNIIFYTNAGLTPNSDFSPTGRVSINSSGNMGIGTLNPTNTLHLIGQARLESYVSNSYDSTNYTKTLGINSTGEVVSVVNQSINNYALVSQTNHGYTTLTPLRYDTGTSIYEEASASDVGLLAKAVFIKAYDINTMIVSSNCIVTIPSHGLDIGVSYYTNPTGRGMVRESVLAPSDIKQHILYVLDGNTLQINLQQKYYE